MNVTNTIKEKYTPEAAIVVYRSQNHHYYIERHAMQLKGNRYQLGAGSPLNEDALLDLVDYFRDKQTKDDTLRGEVPATLLYTHWTVERKVMVWYNIPQLRNMMFTHQLAIPNGTAMQPALIYVLIDKSLRVYAMESTVRPEHITKLYRAPYHNVSSEGVVCLGSAPVNKPAMNSYANVIAYYETLFWASEFSHLAGKETPIKGNLNSYWKKAIKTKSEFDVSVLIPSERVTTFGELLKAITK